MDKSSCRNYINQHKRFLNLKQICIECGVKQPHLTQFLKGSHFDIFLSVEKVNAICDFISNIGK